MLSECYQLFIRKPYGLVSRSGGRLCPNPCLGTGKYKRNIVHKSPVNITQTLTSPRSLYIKRRGKDLSIRELHVRPSVKSKWRRRSNTGKFYSVQEDINHQASETIKSGFRVETNSAQNSSNWSGTSVSLIRPWERRSWRARDPTHYRLQLTLVLCLSCTYVQGTTGWPSMGLIWDTISQDRTTSKSCILWTIIFNKIKSYRNSAVNSESKL